MMSSSRLLGRLGPKSFSTRKAPWVSVTPLGIPTASSELHHAEPTEIATSMLWVSYVLECCRHPAEFWAARNEFYSIPRVRYDGNVKRFGCDFGLIFVKR
jgi:hypothetical protein